MKSNRLNTALLVVAIVAVAGFARTKLASSGAEMTAAAQAFVNTLSSLDPAGIVTIKAAPVPFLMTSLGAMPDLAPLGSDLI